MSNKCGACGKTVYRMEMQKGIGKVWHKLTCFKCQLCTARIEPGSEKEKNGQLVCKNCGNATEGFRGASHANVTSFKAPGDVPPAVGQDIFIVDQVLVDGLLGNRTEESVKEPTPAVSSGGGRGGRNAPHTIIVNVSNSTNVHQPPVAPAPQIVVVQGLCGATTSRGTPCKKARDSCPHH